MLDCLVMGDSIAVGIGQNRPECTTVARVGITSKKWYETYKIKDKNYEQVVISLGTNDFHNITEKSLRKIRSEIKSQRVIWILPSSTLKPEQRSVVLDIAREYRDATVDISGYLGYDHIHPTGRGYQDIAKITRGMR
jgi:lysophospholipase L1-like esterase